MKRLLSLGARAATRHDGNWLKRGSRRMKLRCLEAPTLEALTLAAPALEAYTLGPCARAAARAHPHMANMAHTPP
eukprot:1043376-Prymnesium_polylepis.1